MQTFSQHAEIYDRTNDLTADLHYNPWEDNSYTGMMKSSLKWAFGGKKKKDPTKI